VKRFLDPLHVLEGGLATDLRIATGPETLGELRSELDLDGGQVRIERLCIRVGRDELHAIETARDHGVERVAAAATDTDHFDPRVKLSVCCELDRECHRFLPDGEQCSPQISKPC
jgi:hypothetical protein